METPLPPAPVVTAATSYPTPQQRRIFWTAITAMAVMALIGVAGLVFFGFISFLSWCYPILLPIGLAVIVALVLEPIVGFFQKKRGVKRETATLVVCLIAVVTFVLFWAFILPPLVGEAGGFFKSLPDLLNKGVEKLDASTVQEQATSSSPLQLQSVPNVPPVPTPTNVITQPLVSHKLELPLTHEAVEPSTTEEGHAALSAWLKSNLPAIQAALQKNLANLAYSAMGPVGQAFGFVLGFGFVPIYVYYFLAEEEDITRHWHEFVPLRQSRLRDEVISVLAEINTSLVSYFRGQIIVAGCNGVLTFIGLWIIGIPYSLVLGIITGALSIVPFLGIICSIIPALLLGFLSAKEDPTLQWLRPCLVLVVFAVVQMSESMFITPRVQSHSTGLHPLTIILGILFWSMLLPGLLGPIVAVPLTCAVVVLLRRYVWLQRTKPETAPAEAAKE
jgi:predicted PurR-regulated permease PerM